MELILEHRVKSRMLLFNLLKEFLALGGPHDEILMQRAVRPGAFTIKGKSEIFRVQQYFIGQK
ncbi:hypothetical protein [Azospirillum isscasi]|uniref:hypothetical protein n=1 Tax=Azospirillum isscasi TaxID=3053926 RepID=UPI0027D301C1|nr:hypothetical protein [Azospirillum isscasi]